MLAKKFCLLLFVTLIFASLVCTVWSQGSTLTVTKSASAEELTWDDTVVITLLVKNGASEAISNVTILDYVPDNFEGEPENLVSSKGVINITRATVLPDEEVSYSYTIKGIKDMGTDSNITLRPAQVFFKTEAGDSRFQTSDDIVLTVKSESNKTIALIVQSGLLLLGSFLFGFLGSFINSLAESDVSIVLPDSATIEGTFTNQEGKTAISLSVPKKATQNKQFKADLKIDPELLTEVTETGSYKIEIVLTRNNQVWRKEISWSKSEKELSATLSPEIAGEHSIYCRIINASDKTLVSEYSTKAITIQVNKGLAYNLLIGGVAGMITLASLEALSAIFTDTGLNITVKTIITFTVATVTSGFVPKKILENFTKTLIKEKQDAEKETDKARQQQKESDASKARQAAVDELLLDLSRSIGKKK